MVYWLSFPHTKSKPKSGPFIPYSETKHLKGFAFEVA